MAYELTDKYREEIAAIQRALLNGDAEADIAAVLDEVYSTGSHDGYDDGYDQGYEDAAQEGAGFTDAYDQGYDDGAKAYAPFKVLGAVRHKDYRPAYLAGFKAGWANEASQEAA